MGVTNKWKFQYYSILKNQPIYLIPLAATGLVEYVGGDVNDVTVVQTAPEGRHGVFAVGHLGDDGSLGEATSQVGGEGVLAEGLLVLDDVVAARVAGGAVAGEDVGTVVQVSSVGGGDGHAGSDERRTDLVHRDLRDLELEAGGNSL